MGKKRGRSSGVTSGLVNAINREVQWEDHENMRSEEVEVMGLRMAFAEGGDSGSIVTDQHKDLMRLLLAKDSCASDWGMGFVTPIADIQRDVQRLTGGFLSLE